MKKNFTLLELMIVGIIIAILAALAIPQFIRAGERSRSAEAINLLGALRGAQERYFSENSVYSEDCTLLDVGIPDLRYFFDAADPAPATTPVCAKADPIVKVTRNDRDNVAAQYGNYVLAISTDGTIACTDGVDGSCARIGR